MPPDHPGEPGSPRLVLASRSPRRVDLLAQAGIAFDAVPAAVDEFFDHALSPPELTCANARLKAEHVASTYPERLVLGADTLVYLDDVPLGKPTDIEEAVGMLKRLAGRTHQVCTGVALRRLEPSVEESFHVISEVTFLPLDEPGIRAYLSQIDPLDKAGGYAAQEHREAIIARVDGSFSNVVGLPMERLLPLLRRFR